MRSKQSTLAPVPKNGGRLEKDFGARVRAQLREEFPAAFIYKVPDTFGTGGMRPFDCIAIINGVTLCIEFKRGSIGKPTNYQQYYLDLAEQNGAHSFVINENNRASTLKTIVEIVKRREVKRG